MTTSSKTNKEMESLEKEFGERVKSLALGFSGSQFDFLWEFVQTAISKAHQSGFEEGLEAGMQIDREQFKANFLTQKK